jgi:DNA-directed RNA polymerase specialized sigma24 family protein
MPQPPIPAPVFVDVDRTLAREPFAPLRRLPELSRFDSAAEVLLYLSDRKRPDSERNPVLLALVRAARAGSAIALALLLASFRPWVKCWAFKLSPAPEAKSRILAELSSALSLAVLESFQPGERIESVARTLCACASRLYNRTRRADGDTPAERKRLSAALEVHSLGELAAGPDNPEEARFEARGALAMAVRAGVVTDGEAAFLSDSGSGRSHRELAAEAGTNPVAYRQKLARVRRAVRARMARQGAVAAGPACVAVGATKGGPRGGEATHTLKAVKGAV